MEVYIAYRRSWEGDDKPIAEVVSIHESPETAAFAVIEASNYYNSHTGPRMEDWRESRGITRAQSNWYVLDEKIPERVLEGGYGYPPYYTVEMMEVLP